MSSVEATPPATTSNDDVATTVSGITTATGHGTTAGRGSQGRGSGGRGTGRGRGGRITIEGTEIILRSRIRLQLR